MSVYICMLIFSLLITILCEKYRFVQKKSSKKIKALLISIPFIIVSCFRADTIGIDYRSYIYAYYSYGFKATGRGGEIIAEFVNNMAKRLNNPILIIWFYAITTCFIIVYWIVKESDKYILPIILFFITGTYNWSLNIMRQTLAMSIVYLSIDIIIKEQVKLKDKLIFAGIVWIAGMIHTTASLYIFFLFFPLELFRDRFKSFCLVLLTLPFLSSGLRTIIMSFSQRFNFYYRYFNNYYDQSTYTGSLIFATVVCFLVAVLTYSKWKILDKRYYIKVLMMYLGVATSLIGNIIPNNARITFLFFPYTIISLPPLFKLIRGKYRKYVETLVITCLVYYYIHSFVINNWGETVPYKWVFQ